MSCIDGIPWVTGMLMLRYSSAFEYAKACLSTVGFLLPRALPFAIHRYFLNRLAVNPMLPAQAIAKGTSTIAGWIVNGMAR